MGINNWGKVKINELGFLGRGKSRHRPRNDETLFGGSYPFVETGDVKESEFYITKYKRSYNEKGLAQSKLRPKGTLCITIAGNIAESGILGIDACFPDSIVGFLPDTNKSDVKFIKYYIDTVKANYQRIAKGTTQDNLSVEKMLSLDIFLPPLPTQQRIASILAAYDDLIGNNTRRIKVLEEQAQLIYKEWFVKFKFPGYEKIKFIDSGTEFGMIPEGWEVKEVKEFGEVITGKTPPTANQEYYGDCTMFIKTPDMHGNVFSISSELSLSAIGECLQKNKTVPPKSILVSCIGTLGVVTLTSEPSQFNQQINAIVPSNETYTEYLYFVVKSLKGYLEKLGANGATMGNVNKEKFQCIKVLKPGSHSEEYRNLVMPIFDEILSLQRLNQNLKQTRDMLIPKLVSGEIAV